MATPIYWVTRNDVPPLEIPVTHEFCGGTTDACGPASNANLRACMERRTPTCAEVLDIRTRDAAAGHFGHGQTLGDVWWDLQTYDYTNRALMWPYKAGLAPYAHDELVRTFWTIGASNSGGIIVEVSNASALPHNEAGVKVHYVACLGYDRQHDLCFIANPDRVPRDPHGDWMTVTQLAAASVIGLVYVRPNG